MVKVPEKIELEGTFLKILQAIYDKFTPLNEEKLEPTLLKSGTKDC